MLIEAGFERAFECLAQTPMLLQLSVHPSRDATCSRLTRSTAIPTRDALLHRSFRQARYMGRGSYSKSAMDAAPR
jgi:hypothetical protein